MYSRKFKESSLPPDYSGVSFRHADESGTYFPSHPIADPPCNPREAPIGTPRYPMEDRSTPIPHRRFRLKRMTGCADSAGTKEKAPQSSSDTKGQPSWGALSGRSFTMEDIVLAGLILLLLNSDCDSELILVLGFLLLVGLQ